MADFCKQCSEALFGQDYGDLKGLTTVEDTKAEQYAAVVCEGCGFVLVDHEGRCVSKWPDCQENHNK